MCSILFLYEWEGARQIFIFAGGIKRGGYLLLTWFKLVWNYGVDVEMSYKVSIWSNTQRKY